MFHQSKSITTVQMVIKTNGLEYDDRLRKECLSLERKGYQVEVLSVENKNVSRQGNLYNSTVKNHSFSLMSLKLPLLKLLPFIALVEFALRSSWGILRRRANVIWLHDPVLIMLVPILSIYRAMGIVDKLVWDQHELPIKKIDSSPILRSIYGFFCRRVDVVIEANEDRASYLSQRYSVPRTQIQVINNYSDNDFSEQPQKPLPFELVDWLSGRQYLLLQSGATQIRHFPTVVQAIMSNNAFPPVVLVGGIDPNVEWSLLDEYGEDYKRRFYKVGKVEQMELTRYLDHALASIILYQKSFGPNNWLCEPNRMYQAISRGIPVLVGHNPPMKNVVEQLGNGVVLTDDGTSPEAFTEQLKVLLKNVKENSLNCTKRNYKLSWEEQDEKLGQAATI